ncbi:MAG: YhjD/YihY/BrkB family envelope integrity protein [Puia sp.]|nr:YhjD/YihY/BrkB family envelope integrity protein [Puia sp.]
MTVWFILLFKYLADGRPDWKATIAGGVFTGFLFTLGDSILHLVFSFAKVETIYGASTALVLLLLFIFYSSFIFYYGACFTKMLAEHAGRPVLPVSHAVRYTLQTIDQEGESKREDLGERD